MGFIIINTFFIKMGFMNPLLKWILLLSAMLFSSVIPHLLSSVPNKMIKVEINDKTIIF